MFCCRASVRLDIRSERTVGEERMYKSLPGFLAGVACGSRGWDKTRRGVVRRERSMRSTGDRKKGVGKAAMDVLYLLFLRQRNSAEVVR